MSSQRTCLHFAVTLELKQRITDSSFNISTGQTKSQTGFGSIPQFKSTENEREGISQERLISISTSTFSVLPDLIFIRKNGSDRG